VALERVVERIEFGYDVLLSILNGTDLSIMDFNSSAANDESSNSARVGTDEDDIFSANSDNDLGSSPLDGITKDVMKGIFDSHIGPKGLAENLEAFKAAITWSDPFIISLLCFHAIVIATAVKVSRSSSDIIRLSFLFFISGLVHSAEKLNNYGQQHWESIASQDYFDKNGVFIGIMLCAPLLMICLILMILYIREASNLLVEVKTMRIKQERKKKNIDKNSKKNK